MKDTYRGARPGSLPSLPPTWDVNTPAQEDKTEPHPRGAARRQSSPGVQASPLRQDQPGECFRLYMYVHVCTYIQSSKQEASQICIHPFMHHVHVLHIHGLAQVHACVRCTCARHEKHGFLP